jgi:hypothetical protein
MLGQLVHPGTRRRPQLATSNYSGLLKFTQAMGQHILARGRQTEAQVREPFRAEQQLSYDQ